MKGKDAEGGEVPDALEPGRAVKSCTAVIADAVESYLLISWSESSQGGSGSHMAGAFVIYGL